MTNKYDVAKLLDEIGILLELQGENAFKIRAYHHAARIVENLQEDLEIIVKEERLQELPGIGESIASKIKTFVLTGHLPFHEKLKASMPAGLIELLNIPGIGGKKIKVFYEKLGIKSLEDLIHACRKGEIAQLPHFGKKIRKIFSIALKDIKQAVIDFFGGMQCKSGNSF